MSELILTAYEVSGELFGAPAALSDYRLFRFSLLMQATIAEKLCGREVPN
jgi:hypothetical protein